MYTVQSSTYIVASSHELLAFLERGVVAQWQDSVPSVLTVAGSNPTLAATQ